MKAGLKHGSKKYSQPLSYKKMHNLMDGKHSVHIFEQKGNMIAQLKHMNTQLMLDQKMPDTGIIWVAFYTMLHNQ